MKKSELRQIIKEEIQSILKEDNTVAPNRVEEAYQEAYEFETGDPLFISDYDYDNATSREILFVENLVVNGEDLGDVKLVKSQHGWRLGF